MKFEILRSKGIQHNKLDEYYYFVLIAGNGEIIATSEMYNSKQAAKKGIAAVRKCLFAKVVDNSDVLTV
jgi:uncharacterized protein YegP (UPF0339 family)